MFLTFQSIETVLFDESKLYSPRFGILSDQNNIFLIKIDFLFIFFRKIIFLTRFSILKSPKNVYNRFVNHFPHKKNLFAQKVGKKSKKILKFF